MIVLDTCALLWWTLDPGQLSSKALKTCEEGEKKQGLIISSISIWELGIKVKRKKIDIGMTIDQYVSLLRKANMVEIVPVDDRTWLANLNLSWQHKDPVDRTVVALASLNKCALVTKDDVIRRFYRKTVW